MISFIGYYNYTVILTYISLFCSIAGMLFTVNGWLILCQEKVQIKNDFFPSCQHT